MKERRVTYPGESVSRVGSAQKKRRWGRFFRPGKEKSSKNAEYPGTSTCLMCLENFSLKEGRGPKGGKMTERQIKKGIPPSPDWGRKKGGGERRGVWREKERNP